jgi:hypothetical protein
MGWIYLDLARAGLSLEQAKINHVRDAAQYGPGTTARIIMHEWHPRTWYAIIGLYAAHSDQSFQTPYTVFLRVDSIDTRDGQFGYKDMTEQMGPLVADTPCLVMVRTIFRYIPYAEGDAITFRQAHGIPFLRKARAEAGMKGAP